MKRFITFVLLYALLFVASIISIAAAPIRNLPVTIHQPDGQAIECLASGDEFYNWYHDAAGFTIIQNEADGYYYYAVELDGTLLPSQYKAMATNPSAHGLKPFAKHSAAYIQYRRHALDEPTKPARRQQKSKYEETQVSTTGQINNIVVFIRFAGESEFTDSLEHYNSMFNSTSQPSLKSYYSEVSYNQLTINSRFYPASGSAFVVSYQDTNTRSFYMPYSAANTDGYLDAQRTEREHGLLARCISAVEASIPDTMVIDNDNDGYVDNVCFIVSGATTAWSTLLWPHKWALYSLVSTINGKRVWTYNFQIRDHLMLSNYAVLSHEMFHTLGAPDLYRYVNGDIAPVGPWDLMEWGSGHMCAYMKFKYGGWLDSIPTITTSGTYTINNLSMASNNCYRIRSVNSDNEFYMLEYRKASGSLDSTLPGSGLVVYRINPYLEGNADGPPDEVYAYRPGGTLADDGWVESANFCAQDMRTLFNSSTDPSPFLADGSQGGLRISQIGASGGNTMTFYVTCPSTAVPVLSTPANNSTVVLNPPLLSWAPSAGATSYRVQITTDSTFTSGLTNIVSTSANYQTAGLDYDFKYYWRVRAIGAADSSYWSDFYSFNYVASLYCTVSASCDEYISRVSIGTIDNSSGCSESGYTDFSTISTNVQYGTAYPFTIVNGIRYTYDQCGVWVDWNADGDFDDTGETVTVQGTGGGPFTGNIIVPAGTASGEKRMRIRIVYNLTPIACGYVTYGETEDYTLVVGGGSVANISIPLRAGWNAISSNVVPVQSAASAVFQGIGTNMVLALDKDQNAYIPGGVANNLSVWNPSNAYHVYMSAPDTLTIYGALAIPSNYTIQLEAGWNFVPYLLGTESPVQTALSSIISNVVMVRDIGGSFYSPAFVLNTLGLMKPGYGYFIYMSAPGTLTYANPQGNRTGFGFEFGPQARRSSPSWQLAVPAWISK